MVFRANVDMLAVCSPGHAIARHEDVSLRDLQSYEIALPALNTTARQVFDAACAVEGIVIEPVVTANVLASLIPFVLASNAICVLSELSARSKLRSGVLAAVPIRAPRTLIRSIEI